MQCSQNFALLGKIAFDMLLIIIVFDNGATKPPEANFTNCGGILSKPVAVLVYISSSNFLYSSVAVYGRENTCFKILLD